MQKALPGMRPDGIAEERVIGAPLEPISPAVLLIGPSNGQLLDPRDRVIDDRPVAHRRADDPVALTRQSVNDPLQVILPDRQLGAQHLR
jgi:hypothetical protein